MKFAKWIVMGSGGVVLALLCVILISPKAAHAMVAALVQVTNTRSNPVPTQDVDTAARHPFTAGCNVYGSSGAFVVCQPTPAPGLASLLPMMPACAWTDKKNIARNPAAASRVLTCVAAIFGTAD